MPDRSLLTATTANVAVRSLPTAPEVNADAAERVQHGSFPHGMAAAFPTEWRPVTPRTEGTSVNDDSAPCRAPTARRFPGQLVARRRAGRAGRVPKSLPPKWFYDAAGSELFEKITGLPEYYPTRAEREILQAGRPARSPR